MFPFFTNIFGGEGVSEGVKSRDDPVTKKDTDRGEVNEANILSYAFSGMQGWRVTMEDAHMVCKSIPVQGQDPLRGHALFGVMDGHGGGFTSAFASENFIRTISGQDDLKKYSALTQEDQGDVPGVELLRRALSETFEALDAEIRKKQNQRNDAFLMMTEKAEKGNAAHNPNIRFERSGSTCVVVLVSPSHIICANSGDSRAILRRGGKTLPLSFDHKPSNIPELERVNAAGGFVKGKRVDGDLAVSRGLGDFSYKSNETKPVEQQKVIPEPEILVYPRKHDLDEFLVLACDGVWDVASNEQCSTFVQELLEEGESDMGLICEEAMDMCLEKNSRDNMTIAMVSLKAMKMHSGLQARNAVWQRRTARQARHFHVQANQAAVRAAAGVGISFSMQERAKKPVSVGSK
jgi:serine/threonine protein phosphatase PrpC